MNIAERPNRSKTKIFYFVEWGRDAGQRQSLEIFTYIKPKNQIEKNHNKEVENLLAVKKSQLVLEQQAISSGYIPSHKFKSNFLDYYEEYVKNNKVDGNRHLTNSLAQFKDFMNKDFVAPLEITEELITRFRQYLLKKFTGDTPANYFAKYKKVIKAATKVGYFRTNPAEDVKAKSSPSKRGLQQWNLIEGLGYKEAVLQVLPLRIKKGIWHHLLIPDINQDNYSFEDYQSKKNTGRKTGV